MSAYPVAYRKGAAVKHSVSRGIGSGSQVPRPRPANDNTPAPANDNVRDLMNPEQQRKLARTFLQTASKAARIAARRSPYLQIAAIAVEAVYNETQSGLSVIPGAPVFVKVPPLHEDPKWTVTGWPTFEVHRPGHEFHAYHYGVPNPSFLYDDDPPYAFPDWEWLDSEFASPTVRPYVTIIEKIFEAPLFGGPARWFYSVGATARYNAPFSTYTNPQIRPGVDQWIGHSTAESGSAAAIDRINMARVQLGQNVEPDNRPRVIPQGARLNEVAVATTGTAPKLHYSRRPPRGRKEKKFVAQAQKEYRQLAKIFGHLTEVGDFIEGIWEAIPEKYRTGYYEIHGKGGKLVVVKRHDASMQQMAEDIYRHLDKVDMTQAVWNIATNQIEDAVIGKLGKAQQRQSKDYLNRLGRPVGFGTGGAI